MPLLARTGSVYGSVLPIGRAAGGGLDCTSNFSGTNGSGDFASDYLTVSNGTDWDFGTGDYTAECWFNLDSTGDAYLIQSVTDNGEINRFIS